MTSQQPVRPADINECIDRLIGRLGRDLRVGLPLGLGKPNRLVNALYDRAKRDGSLQLTIYTALTLEVPPAGVGLRGRLSGPVIERLYGPDYPHLAYQRDLRRGRLPSNVRVHEFFFTPARLLNVKSAQRDYLASNYTHVARDMMARGVNLLLQLVAREHGGREARYSLSCNPDVTLDLVDLLRADGREWAMVGQVHRDLPFMEGDAAVESAYFHYLIEDPPETYPLFSMPKEPVDPRDHRIGLNASTLVRDGGTLQIGIGALGDALVNAMLLRHRDNDLYRGLLDRWGVLGFCRDPIRRIGGTGTFERGLYGCSEMLVDGFLRLLEAGIIKRPVFEDRATRERADAGSAVDEPGVLVHGGFFLGPPGFYRELRDLAPELRRRIHMTSVGRINQLYGNEDLRRRQRRDARFINSCLKLTLSGSVVSDGLDDHRVLSGVGGQYNFVAMAHALPDGRSVIMARSTRGTGRKLESNIVWHYGNITIPRHLRDVVVTEYGIADLRGKSDEEVIRSMISIADSRFQQVLRRDAVKAGKLDPAWRIPEHYRDNTPERLRREMAAGPAADAFPSYPFGSELDAAERDLARALAGLRERMEGARVGFLTALGAVWRGRPRAEYAPHLARMGLAAPAGLKERFHRRLVCGALREAGVERQ